ncbi:MAG: hypothetical protein CM15mP88_1500 [Pseudomonadota bacterium]|nr:MAG: hypothetical protein CM15mP88_1500 [Pseudomonadota bacterium]
MTPGKGGLGHGKLKRNTSKTVSKNKGSYDPGGFFPKKGPRGAPGGVFGPGERGGPWGDVAATAKRTLKAGEMLDGEGGYTVWGKLLPASTSLERRALPLGLAHQVKVIRDVPEGDTVTWDDVEMDTSLKAYSIRKEFEKAFS